MTTKQFLNSEESMALISDSEELNKSIILGNALIHGLFISSIFSLGARNKNNE